MTTTKENSLYQELNDRLQSDHKHLKAQLESLKASAPQEGREGSPFGKREEEAAETSELENRLVMEKLVIDQIAEVENALNKLEKGTFGKCEKCGQAMDPARLTALPYAKLCMTCKAKQVKPV
ncbi:MAG: molecular chaperone DnaK [Dehalococcoidia bacterium]|nr:MAG: molecular chaperone DnaK [Dehalococcoidia bacterium]